MCKIETCRFVENYSISYPVVILKFSGLADFGFLSFVLEFMFTFIEGTGVSNFPFISNSDADVSGLADYWLLAFGFGVYLYV